MNDFGNGLLVAFGIGLLIFVHEFGHYLAARWIGAQVEVFSLGFGPRLLGFRRGPTDYRLSMIPLGGFVMVAGQDPGDQRHPGPVNLHQKTVGQRALFFSGGVAMNLLFALVAFPIAFGSGVSFPAPQVGNVEIGGGAWEARIEAGDRVLAINGKQMYSFENLVVEVALTGGRPVTLLLERDGQQRTVEVRPQFRPVEGVFAIGIDSALADRPQLLSVTDGGAAARAGLRNGDRLLAIDGRSTVGKEAVAALSAAPPAPNAPTHLLVRRGDAELAIEIVPVAASTEGPAQLGVQPQRRRVGGIRRDLPVLAAIDLQHGDVLIEVDGAPFVGNDLAVAAAGDDTLRLLVRRGDRELMLKAPITPAQRQQLAAHVALVQDVDGMVLDPVADGAARAAGIEPGDRLVALGGRPVADWNDLRARVLAAGAVPLQLEIERRSAPAPALPVRLQRSVQPQPRPQFDYGFTWQAEPKRDEVRASGFVDALRLGSVCALDLTKQLYVTVKRLLTGDVAAKNLGGIIQISRASYQNTQWGLPRFLYFLALLSINLAFINVLPIPVLDGGHLLFLLIERVKGSPVSSSVLNYSQVLGLVLVLALVLFVTYNDILRLL